MIALALQVYGIIGVLLALACFADWRIEPPPRVSLKAIAAVALTLLLAWLPLMLCIVGFVLVEDSPRRR